MATIVRHYRLPAEKEGKEYKKTGMPNVNQLREFEPGVTRWQPHPTGGATLVTIEDRTSSYTGATMCSMSEAFSYKRGKHRATLRAKMHQRLIGN